jgi:hypothetical protein
MFLIIQVRLGEWRYVQRCAALLLLVPALFPIQFAWAEGPGIEDDVRLLIRQLGDPSFFIRERAQRELTKLPWRSVEHCLEEAAISRDPEVRARVTSIIAAFEKLSRRDMAERMARSAAHLDTDVFVEQAVAWKYPDGDEVWKAAYTLGSRLTRIRNILNRFPPGTPPHLSFPDAFDRTKSDYWSRTKIFSTRDIILSGEGLFLWRGHTARVGSDVMIPIAIARETIDIYPSRALFLFSAGDIAMPRSAFDYSRHVLYTIMICGGAFRFPDPGDFTTEQRRKLIMIGGLVICAGDVRLGERASIEKSAVLAGGNI